MLPSTPYKETVYAEKYDTGGHLCPTKWHTFQGQCFLSGVREIYIFTVAEVRRKT